MSPPLRFTPLNVSALATSSRIPSTPKNSSDGTPDLADLLWKQASFLSHQLDGDPEPGTPVGNTGCEQVPFEPEISVRPTTTQADSPSGLEVDLSIPQDELTDPAAIAQSDLRDTVLRLPAGMTVNPAQAAGLGACTLAQIDLHHRNTEPTCPDASKIGTVQIKSPLLEEELEGTVYLGAQKDNPFDSLLALYIVAYARGQIVKLAGQVEPTPEGLVTTFEDNPQLPFSHFHVALKGGPRGALITPRACGPHTATATLTPWSGNAPVELSSSFQITEGPSGAPCPAGQFDPHLSAGTESPLAAAYTPFHLRLSREDGTRELTGLSATLPPGLLGRLAGIPYCPESALAAVSELEGSAAAQIAAPSCPAASLLGHVVAGAGAGPTPFFLETGRAYLAGPYKGAPLSLAVITPALAGPFDLGNVLVRTALRINPETTQLTAASDPLPLALHGIPLDLRDLRIAIDRPGFTLNPTSCDPMSIDADIAGTEGASAHRSERFQVANCADLPFRPKLNFRLKGKVNRTAHPKLIASLTVPRTSCDLPRRSGARAARVCRQLTPEANIARAQVKLPPSAFLDNSHIRGVCTRVQYSSGRGGGEGCPPSSIYGQASAISPLLDQPLSGPVYLRSSEHTLPDLVASLDGQIHVDLLGRTDSVKGALRNTFEAVPDAPVSSFRLELFGGRRGLIEMSSGFCRHPRATVKLDGQNGKTHDTTPVVHVSDCGANHRKASKHGRARR